MSKVYVCDDDIVIHMMVKRILGKVHEVVTCSNIDALIVKLKESAADLILLDYQMPDCNGFDALIKLREGGFFPSIPVAIVTGEKDSELEEKFRAEGVAELIDKPFVPANLTERVSDILSRA